ncbi:unnamed protein product [Chrysoparadoxa australica]
MVGSTRRASVEEVAALADIIKTRKKSYDEAATDAHLKWLLKSAKTARETTKSPPPLPPRRTQPQPQPQQQPSPAAQAAASYNSRRSSIVATYQQMESMVPQKMGMVQLRRCLRALGKPTAGLRPALVTRVQSAIEKGEVRNFIEQCKKKERLRLSDKAKSPPYTPGRSTALANKRGSGQKQAGSSRRGSQSPSKAEASLTKANSDPNPEVPRLNSKPLQKGRSETFVHPKPLLLKDVGAMLNKPAAEARSPSPTVAAAASLTVATDLGGPPPDDPDRPVTPPRMAPPEHSPEKPQKPKTPARFMLKKPITPAALSPEPAQVAQDALSNSPKTSSNAFWMNQAPAAAAPEPPTHSTPAEPESLGSPMTQAPAAPIVAATPAPTSHAPAVPAAATGPAPASTKKPLLKMSPRPPPGPKPPKLAKAVTPMPASPTPAVPTPETKEPATPVTEKVNIPLATFATPPPSVAAALAAKAGGTPPPSVASILAKSNKPSALAPPPSPLSANKEAAAALKRKKEEIMKRVKAGSGAITPTPGRSKLHSSSSSSSKSASSTSPAASPTVASEAKKEDEERESYDAYEAPPTQGGKGDDAEDEEEDQEDRTHHEHVKEAEAAAAASNASGIPDWARGQNLAKILNKQYGGPNPMDPDTIFPEFFTCDLERIFDTKKKRYRTRNSTGNWMHDRLTDAEVLAYKKAMNYLAA